VVVGTVLVGTVVVGTVLVGTVVVVGTVDVVAVVHVGTSITLSSKVTAPLRLSIRPATVVPVSTDAEVSARRLPANLVEVPRVAELPTCQKTLHACAPPIRATELLEAVVSVDPIWKTNTAFGSLCASRVTVPVRLIAVADL
jgi:hypothetical protein